MMENDETNDTSENLLHPANSGEVIHTDRQHYNSLHSSDSSEEQIDQDKVVVKLEDFKAELTNVVNILPPDCYKLREKDKFDIIKFTIKVKAVYIYQWEVYRKPNEIKKHFAEVLKELSKNYMTPTGEKLDIFTKVASWPDDSIQSHIQDIENYYKTLFQDLKIYNVLSFKEFFNISAGSFNQYNSGNKPFEGKCYKKADPKCIRTAFSIACKCIEYFAFSQYNLRWIVVKDDCIYYMNKSNAESGKNVYFFDRDLKVKKEGRDIINITNISRSIILKFKTVFERELWYLEIMKRADAMMKVLSNNPYKAYTNEKKGNLAYWFSDGQDYFKDLSEKLMQAKETIFITDWWMSPEVWLTRPVGMNTYMAMAYQKQNLKTSPPYSRLMDILYACANRGVKVYVLVYAECSLALTLNSAHTGQALNIHENIQFERHPLNCTDLLWSHHEKLVIIDQIIGYVGGLDLCWGRYDTHDHPIYEAPNDEQSYYFPGIDYSNARIRDFDKVDNYLAESCDRKKELRMPWHDVHSRLIGPVVADIARHFVERWNFSRFGTGSGITNIKQNASVSYERSRLEESNTLDEELSKKNKPVPGGFLMGIINQVNEKEKREKELKEKQSGLIPEESSDDSGSNINTGNEGNKTIFQFSKKLRGKKNLGNEARPSLSQKEGYKEEQELKEQYMKHKQVIDEDHLYVRVYTNEENQGGKLRGKRLKEKISKIKGAAPRKSAVEMNNSIEMDLKLEGDEKEEKNDIEESHESLDVEQNEGNNSHKGSYYDKLVKNMKEAAKKNKGGWFSNLLSGGNQHEEQKLETNVVNVNFFQKGTKSHVQVLRSACKWSAGIGKKENSILQGYYHLIDNAEHFLYIENQFFVSRAFSEEERRECKHSLSDVVENLIAYHIRKRIERAYLSKEKFRVFIFIPLLPGFAGEPESSSTLQIILKHTFAGICRNHGMSIIEQLEKIMGDKWKEYIGFYSLRGHALVNNMPETELIYIHSKLMIVDDKTVILGSANINDRSMLGKRDSEYAVMINETRKLNSLMDGKPYKAANFAHSFRVNLFAEHLGIDPKNPILNDPLSDEFLQLVQNTAHNNTLIYRKLFRCYPDDTYLSFKDLREHKKPTTPEEIENFRNEYLKEKDGIVGHAVEFPLHFLEKENLGSFFFSVENIVPEKNFT